MPHQVFLSHAGEDAQKAGQLCAALETAGIACWIAPRDIPAGANYAAEIVGAIDTSRLMVLLYSSQAAASRHVRSELERAFNDGARIVAVRIDEHEMATDMQYFISTGQWIDAFGGEFQVELPAIVKAITGALAGAAVPRTIASARRQLALKWSVPAVLIIALMIAFFWWKAGGRSGKPEPVAQDKNAGVAATGSAPAESKAATPPPPADVPPPKQSSERINPKDGLKYVRLPAGRFFMGCSAADSECEEDEKPAHWVTIPKPFWLGQTEVTMAAFDRYARASKAGTPSRLSAADASMPKTGIDRAEAVAFCRWAGGRLPTEAEWEYAARGAQAEPRYGSLFAIAWIDANSDEKAHPVAQKEPNAYGLYDMLGNVSEWVFDRYYKRYYEEEPGAPPEAPIPANATAVARGGSWAFGPASARASNRAEMEKDEQEPFVGVRCASDAP